MPAVGGLREVNSVSDLVKIDIQWDEIALDAYLKSHSTSPELLFAGILACTNALTGNTTVKLFNSFQEKGNLLMLGLAPSRAGK